MERQTERRIIGPPGTGKTTELTRLVQLCVDQYGPDDILITSFTRAAAAEIAGRDLPLPADAVGTLHAHCYRALNRPEIAETQIGVWNERYPQWALVEQTRHLDEPESEQIGNTESVRLKAQYEIYRARITPRDRWEPPVVLFADLWEAWKKDEGLLDFTDLIETCLRETSYAPNDPRVLMYDEAQDGSPLELALLRKWAQHVDVFYVAGDPEQALYTFKGADGRAFRFPEIPDDDKRVLAQSYRVPRAVHEYATAWIQGLSERDDVTYYPRDAEGVVGRNGATWQEPEGIVGQALRQIDDGKTAMILTTCGYMLEPTLAVLRKNGIPFGNKYRRKRGDWNPLGAARGVTASQRILHFLRPQRHIYLDQARLWAGWELHAWACVVESNGVLVRGAKQKLSADDERVWTRDELAAIFEPVALECALGGDVAWYVEHVLPSKRAVFAYPLRVLEKRGIRGLQQTPRLTVGTGHSVKGGEADWVALYPDVSLSGWNSLTTDAARDAMRRLFYVMMTRAKESLTLGRNATSLFVELPS